MLKRRKRNREEESPELNLIPIMNLFVCLLPFLLLTAAFVKMGGIRAEVPATRSADQTQVKVDQNEIIDLVFQVDGTQVEVAGFTESFANPIADIGAKFSTNDPEALRVYLDELSKKHPKWGSTLFKASAKTRFEDAISVLGQLRSNQHIKNLVLAAEVVN